MNVRDIAQSAIGDTGGVDSLLVEKWVADRFVEITTATLAKPMRRLLELTIPKTITAGLITTTQGSKTVTGDATAIAAWSNSLVGRYLRGSSKNGWYEIAAFANNTIELKTPWVETALSAAGYTIVPRTIALPKEIRSIGAMRNLKHNIPIERVSLDDLDKRQPGRTQTAGGPVVFSEVSINDNEQRVLEFYPYSDEDVLVAYTGYLKPRRLVGRDEIPNYVDPYILIEGVKMNIYEKKMTEALNAGQADVGATWGNLARSQRTIWKGSKVDFVVNNQTVDDAKVLLESYGSGNRAGGSDDVMNASQHILQNWNPLV